LEKRLGWEQSQFGYSGGQQSQSGYGGGEKNSCPCRELNPGCPKHSLVIILTELFWPYKGKLKERKATSPFQALLQTTLQDEMKICTLCATKIKCFKFSKP
jgi:hypothetical protein